MHLVFLVCSCELKPDQLLSVPKQPLSFSPFCLPHTMSAVEAAKGLGTVVVVGANRGIGLGLAKALLERGWRVVAVCRNSSQELTQLGVEVLAGVDVGHDSCIETLRQHFRGQAIALLVSNAGLLRTDSLDALDFAGMQLQYDVNALGPLRVVSALRDYLAPGSKVALITSKMGSLAETIKGGGMYGYRMSKAAANMAGRLLASDLRERQVAVGLLHPGAVLTDMFDTYWAAAGKGGMAPSTHGYIRVEESVAGLMARIDEISLETSGEFRHQTGEVIPW